MPAPYSLDLRQKAITAIESGQSKVVVSRLLGIARSTLTAWHHQYRRDGNVAPKHGYQQGHSHKITDWQKFRAFVCDHADKTQEELAELWPENISDRTISRALKKINFTRKKRLTDTKNVTHKRDRYFSNS